MEIRIIARLSLEPRAWPVAYPCHP